MNPLLIREAFADANASAQASNEAPTVNAETVRIAERYISLANSSVAVTPIAQSVRTVTLDEYRAGRKKKA